MLHLKACAKTRSQRLADYLMIAFGVIATVYTSIGTIKVRDTFYVLPVGRVLLTSIAAHV